MEKVKKPIYKKWWFWVIIVVVVFAIAAGGSGSDKKDSKKNSVAGTEKMDNKDAKTQRQRTPMQKMQNRKKIYPL